MTIDKPTILDPEVLDWVTDDRLLRFKSEIICSYSILQWSDLLRKVTLNWVRKEVVSGEVNSPIADSYTQEVDNILMRWAAQRWETTLESKYLESKHLLDKVTYSLIRVSDQYLAFELYHRAKAKEVAFEQLSWQYGEGKERLRGGLISNQRFSDLPQAFHPLFRKIYPGEILKPHKLGDSFVLIYLQHFHAAQFDEETQALLLRRELDCWLNAVVDHLCNSLN